MIDTEARFAIPLWHDDDGACPCTMARFYNLKHLVDLIGFDLPIEWPRAIRLCPDGYGIRWGNDGVLSGMDSSEGAIPHRGMRA